MWINEKRITPLQLFIVVIGIFYFLYNDTEIIQSLPDIVKVGIYAGILVITAAAGISLVNVKEIATKIKDIMQDRKMTPHEKLNAMMGVALPLLSDIGDLWDVVTKEQFDKVKAQAPPPEPAKT